MISVTSGFVLVFFALTLVDADGEPGEEGFIAQCSPLKPHQLDMNL